MSDEGFREIQLNGKQLVFLFMAATVVSVVIFLCGVLVGRGVRPDRPAAAESASAEVAPDPGTAAPPVTTPAPRVAAEPPPPADDLSYFDRLEKDQPPAEKLKSPSAERATSGRPVPKAAQAGAKTAPADTRTAPTATGEPSGPGFAVQVQAFHDRKDADAAAKRLVSKGYPAFVMSPGAGGAVQMYRVRVGKYKDRHDAEAVAHRLETEEQFKPWIAR